MALLGSLNTRTINKDTLNSGIDPNTGQDVIDIETLCLGEFNAAPMNSYEFNGCQFLASLGVQNILRVAQLVGVTFPANTAISITQDVQLSANIASFNAIELEQNVKTDVATDTVIELAQVIDGPGTFLDIHGWDADIIINDVSIPRDRIDGSKLIITKESNNNTLCEFSVRVADPIGFLEFIDGGDVTINYLTADGGFRLFTGIVDLPEIDLVNELIKIKCSNRREELIKLQLLPLLPSIGRYSKQVQGEITSVKQEMEYRLETTPKDVDFDSYNNPDITSWYPKATPDYTLNDIDVFHREPKITWQSRGGVTNDITVTLKYRYTRLHHYERSFSWVDSGDPSAALGYRFDNAASHATVGMIQAAIDQAGWKERNSLTYTDEYVGGVCFSLTFGGNCLNLLNDEIGSYRSQNIAPPHQYITTLYAIPPATTDAIRVTSAAWTGSTRFSQNIEEVYTCNVYSTQSITQFGSLTAFANHTVEETFDSNEWDIYRNYTPAPANAIVQGPNFSSNQDSGVGVFNNAILTAIDRAKTKIIASHRDTVVSIETPLMPQLELRHTVKIDTQNLVCKGKTTRIKHIIDLGDKAGQTTEIDIALLKALGNGVETPTTLPARPVDIPHYSTEVVRFGTRRDQPIETTPGSDTWNGYIGSLNHGTQSTMTTKFIVDTPAIPAEISKLRSLAVEVNYETAILNDELDIEFDG